MTDPLLPSSDSQPASPPRVAAAIACDFALSPIGTRSRLLDNLAGTPVLHRTLRALDQVTGLSEIILLIPPDQLPQSQELQSLGLRTPLKTIPLEPRPTQLTNRVQSIRHWDLPSWRGGAGQLTVFDEDFHPAALLDAAQSTNADHLLVLPAHAPFLDAALTSQLIHHHLHKNHEMRFTYTPSAPGLTGIILQRGILEEMAAANVLPGQLLGYDPNNPTFDTLIRDACMQVDPALSKIQNRFLVDTDRSFALAQFLLTQNFSSPAEMALAARNHLLQSLQTPSVSSVVNSSSRELEIELTPNRLTSPPGSLHANRDALPLAHWSTWLASQNFPDDLLLTLAGDGDPLLSTNLLDFLRLARQAKPLSIHLQTDLASDISPLLAAIQEDLLDVISVNFYGHDAPTYAKVANADLFPTVMANMQKLADATRTNPRGTGLPLVIPRLLKVRETIPHLEPFFDYWVRACGWAVIDYPTDRAGSLPFTAVTNMAPPKRRPCRRLADRLLLHSDGTALPCDQDTARLLALGNIQTHSLQQLWLSQKARTLRTQHAEEKWNQISPCLNCKEWHRA